MDAPPFERLGLVGLGLIGGSVALAARRRWPSVRITACDPAPVATEAVSQGLLEAIVESPAGLSECDLIVIATPVQVVTRIFEQLSNARVPALVTDTSSTKRAVMAAAQSNNGIMFVGGHPVTGSEGSGLAAARADLFDGRPWLLVSAAAARPGESRGVKESMLASFVVGLGARPEWTDAVTHDRVMAHVSHAPQVVSSALLAASGAAGVGDSESWRGILETNADFIADALVAIAAKLPTSSSALTDAPAVRDIFERAKALKSHQ
ncbi:MAG: prephenate dehydrogenase/arogenate dehydrogenase family protein [Vicinamibacterales bacterium]